jgi:hypothetical protein
MTMYRWYVWYRDYSDELCKVWTDAETKEDAKDNVRRDWSVKRFVDIQRNRVINENE